MLSIRGITNVRAPLGPLRQQQAVASSGDGYAGSTESSPLPRRPVPAAGRAEPVLPYLRLDWKTKLPAEEREQAAKILAPRAQQEDDFLLRALAREAIEKVWPEGRHNAERAELAGGTAGLARGLERMTAWVGDSRHYDPERYPVGDFLDRLAAHPPEATTVTAVVRLMERLDGLSPSLVEGADPGWAPALAQRCRKLLQEGKAPRVAGPLSDLDYLVGSDFKAMGEAAARLSAQPETLPLAVAAMVERLDYKPFEEHFELMRSALEQGAWKPSERECRWLVAQLVDPAAQNGRSIMVSTGGFANVARVTDLLAKIQDRCPEVTARLELPDCSGSIVPLPQALTDILLHNSEDQPGLRTDPFRHPELEGLYRLARPTPAQREQMLATVEQDFEDIGVYKRFNSEGQMALSLLSIAFARGELSPREAARARRSVRPALVHDPWRWQNNFAHVDEVLNRFRGPELEETEGALRELQGSERAQEGRRLMLVASGLSAEAGRELCGDLAGLVWSGLEASEKEALFQRLAAAPATDPVEWPLDLHGDLLLAGFSNEPLPETVEKNLAPALEALSDWNFSKSQFYPLCRRLAGDPFELGLAQLAGGELNVSDQLETLDLCLSSEQEPDKAPERTWAAWEAGLKRAGRTTFFTALDAPEARLETFRTMAEVAGERAWEAWPMAEELLQWMPVEDLPGALGRAWPVVEQGGSFKEALRSGLAASVGAPADSGKAATVVREEEWVSIGGARLPIRR